MALFNSTFYLSAYADVASAVASGVVKSAEEHYNKFGISESRLPNAFFNPTYYLQQNPTVASAVAAGVFKSALEHFEKFGLSEGRMPSEFFNASEYLINNPDVQQAINAGIFKSAVEHFSLNGFTEGRAPSSAFNPTAYLNANADVKAAVAAGTFKSAFEHFLLYGSKEGRSALGTGGSSGSLGDTTFAQTLILTKAIDNLVGSAGNDSIIGANDTSAESTLNTGDVINGSAGTDRLSATIVSNPTLVFDVKDVEQVYIRSTTGTATFYAASWTGVQEIWSDRSANAVTVNNVKSNVAVGVNEVDAAATFTVAFDTAVTTGATDSVTVVAKNTGSDDKTANDPTVTLNATSGDFETVVLTTQGTKTSVLADLNGTAIDGANTKLNITGDQGVKVVAALGNTITTVDASGNKGGVDILLGNDAVKVTGGSGNDRIAFASGQLLATDTVDGGTGTNDTLKIAAAADFTAANLKNVTGFETLEVNADGGTIDFALLSGLKGLVYDPTGNTNLTVNNLVDAANVKVMDDSSGQVILNIKDATLGGTANTLNLNLHSDANTAGGNGVDLSDVRAAGTEVINLSSTRDSSVAQQQNSVLSLANSTSTTTVNVTGDTDLLVTTGNNATLTKVDASAFTGVLTLNGGTTAAALLGGTGNDTIVGNTANDSIVGGAGNDSITGAAGADNLTGGTGNDIFRYTGADAANAGVANVDRITDFVAGTDKFSFDTAADAFLTGLTIGAATVNFNTAQTIATAADVTAVYAGISAITASTNTVLQAAMVTVTAGGAAGTYLYINDNAGTVVAAEDFLVNVTGLTGTLTASDFIFA